MVGPTCAYESINWPLAYDRVTHVIGIVLVGKSTSGGSGSKNEAGILNMMISQFNKAGYTANTLHVGRDSR